MSSNYGYDANGMEREPFPARDEHERPAARINAASAELRRQNQERAESRMGQPLTAEEMDPDSGYYGVRPTMHDVRRLIAEVERLRSALWRAPEDSAQRRRRGVVRPYWRGRGMTLATLQPGARIADRGSNVYADDITVGYVVRVEEPDATGTAHALVLTDSQPSQAKRRAAHLILHHQDGRKGAYVPLGPVARLVRLPLESIDPASLSHYSDHHALWAAARKALLAAGVAALPGFRDRGRHDELIEAYLVLRDAAIEKEMGIE